jgi:hypothetical protein
MSPASSGSAFHTPRLVSSRTDRGISFAAAMIRRPPILKQLLPTAATRNGRVGPPLRPSSGFPGARSLHRGRDATWGERRWSRDRLGWGGRNDEILPASGCHQRVDGTADHDGFRTRSLAVTLSVVRGGATHRAGWPLPSALQETPLPCARAQGKGARVSVVRAYDANVSSPGRVAAATSTSCGMRPRE